MALLALFITACGGNKSKQEGVTRNELLERKAERFVLYMDKRRERKFAPDGQPFIHDTIVNKIFWRVMECAKPVCPGRIAGRPHLFILPDHSVSVSEGAILYADSFDNLENQSDNEVQVEGLCPKCERGLLKLGVTQFKNDGLKVSDQMKLEKKKLKQFVKPYDGLY
jgi:hypothetical protein